MSKAELTIAGRRYVLGCAPGQEERLQELGRRFDARVQDLVDALGDIGPERLFLAAGLSLLDDLDSHPEGADARQLDERIRGLEARAATLLTEAAARIEAISSRIDRAS